MSKSEVTARPQHTPIPLDQRAPITTPELLALMASNADLLAALKSMVAFAEHEWKDTHTAMRAARAAIARAEGRDKP